MEPFCVIGVFPINVFLTLDKSLPLLSKSLSKFCTFSGSKVFPRPKALKIPHNLALIWVCKFIRKIEQFFALKTLKKQF